MYYGISQSTDLRHPKTVVKKFTSLRAAHAWAKIGNGDYTYKDPDAAQNWHHTFKYVYELRGRINKKDPVFGNLETSCYPRCHEDNLATYIKTHGWKVDEEGYKID